MQVCLHPEIHCICSCEEEEREEGGRACTPLLQKPPLLPVKPGSPPLLFQTSEGEERHLPQGEA